MAQIRCQIDAETRSTFVFIFQATKEDGEPISAAQMETARNVMASVLENLGAEVKSNAAIVPIETNGEDGALVVDATFAPFAESTDETESEPTDETTEAEEN